MKKQNSCVTESFGYALGRISLYVVLIALVFIERQKAVPGVGMVTCFTVFVVVCCLNYLGVGMDRILATTALGRVKAVLVTL